MSTPSTFFLRRRQHLGKRRLVAWLIGATLVLQVAVSTLQAAEGSSPYDLLGRVLVPWVAILASEREADAARALTVAARVEASQGFPVDATGQRAEFSLEYPDKLRLHVPFWCEHFTVARRGELLWVAPGSRLKALLARPEVAKRLPEPDRKFKLAPFRLPLTAKEMAFLPALFQVREMAPQPLEGTTCRVLDLQLTALLSKSVAIAGWSAQLWVNPLDQPVRLLLTGPTNSVTLRLDQVTFAPTLPPETWVPGKALENDVVIVPPARYDQLLRALLGSSK